MRRFARSALFVLRLVALIGALASSRAGAQWSGGGPIVFLGDRDLAPYEFLVNGVPRGVNVDLAQAIGRVLGRPVEVQLFDWSEAQQRFQAGHGDVLTLLASTPERERSYDFTQSTVPVSFALFVRTEERSRLDGGRPLAGRRIGVTAGGIAHALLEQRHPDASFVVVANLLDGTRRLVNGDIDAFAAQVWPETFLLDELGIRGISALPPFAERISNMAVREGEHALRADLDRALTELKASGELDRIIDRWTGTRLRLVPEWAVPTLAAGTGAALAALLALSVWLWLGRRRRAELTREIDERRNAERALRDSQLALEAADRRKDRFIATLAHELRNPLAPISNAVQLLELKGGATPGARWAQQVIRRQVSHLTRLIDDLLDVGRITSNKLELRRAPVPLATVLDEAIEVSRPVIDGFRHRLELTAPPAPLWVDVDRARLVQVLMNLLTNAAKYMPGPGVIELGAAVDGGDLELRVRDSGVGIARERLDHVFEMFYQEDRARPHARGGLGIGLWLTRQLVQMHGGSIEAHSAGADQGAEFVLRLPGALCAPPAAAGAAPAAAAARAQRVLVVDDNVDSAESAAQLLAALGCTVATAFDGEQALARGAALRPALVLLDLAMPGLSGFDVCRRLRQLDWGRAATVVAMTGWGGRADREASRAAGFDAHLVKPIDPATLAALLAGDRPAAATAAATPPAAATAHNSEPSARQPAP